MTNNFYFDDDDSSHSSDDLSSLPYPKPLARDAFLAPDFEPNQFLASLGNRYQTLEDLRSELRQRSAQINKELLDLVNSNYEDFIGLGQDLKGGDEKVEEIRLEVLSFQKELHGVKNRVKARREEVDGLIAQRREVRKSISFGRDLLEVERRVEALEARMMLLPRAGDNVSDASDLEESDDEADGSINLNLIRLKASAEHYLSITELVARLGAEQPFLLRLSGRIGKLKQTILLDLKNALKQARGSGANEGRLMTIMLPIYSQMDESHEAIKTLKELRRP